MKKLVSLFLFSVILITASFSQQLSIGLKPSFLILDSKLSADLKGYPSMKLKPRCSYGIGVTVSEQIKKFGFNIEPRFIVKGFYINPFGLNEITIYRNNYLSMPALLTFSPTKHLNLEIGPEFSYLLNSKVKYPGSNSFVINDSNNLRSFELSLITGVSYTLIKNIDLGIRYGIGLTPVDKHKLIINGSSDPPVNYKFMQRYFEFSLTLRFI
jgi:hypothetical protein